MATKELPYNSKNEMTPTQREIIEFPIDPNSTLQITSGPGSGKTTTLVHKIAHLIKEGLDPYDIVVLSMTNRAIENIKHSLTEMIEPELVERLNISTFHSFCHKAIIEYDESYKDIDIIEGTGWRTVLQLIGVKRLTKYDIERIVGDLKKWRIEDENDKKIELIVSARGVSRKYVIEVLRFLKQLKALTHPDILKLGKEYITNGSIQLRHKVTIVDEFQDMFEEIFELTKLVSKNSHLVVAGDPNQSIYGFLGPNVAVMEDLHTFKPVHKIEMKETFRSSPEIIHAANSILSKSSQYKTIMTPSSEKPVLQTFVSTDEQYEFIALEILRLIQESNGQISRNDIAILTRTNADISQIIKILNYFGIPSTKLSSTPSWLSNELFHLVDYLRILQNPQKSTFSILSTLGLVNKIGPLTIKKLHNESILREIPFYDLLFQSSDYRIKKYVELLQTTRSNLDYNDPIDIFQKLLHLGYELGLSSKIQRQIKNSVDKNNLTLQLIDFQENLKLLHYRKPPEATLVEYFLENYSNIMPIPQKETIKVSTVHSAKGLEFPVVFFPNFEKRWNTEEKVLYVGMTRAKNLLYCSGTDTSAFNYQYFQKGVPKITEKLLRGLSSIRAFHTLCRI